MGKGCDSHMVILEFLITSRFEQLNIRGSPCHHICNYNLKTTIQFQFVAMIMIYVHKKLYMPSSSQLINYWHRAEHWIKLLHDCILCTKTSFCYFLPRKWETRKVLIEWDSNLNCFYINHYQHKLQILGDFWKWLLFKNVLRQYEKLQQSVLKIGIFLYSQYSEWISRNQHYFHLGIWYDNKSTCSPTQGHAPLPDTHTHTHTHTHTQTNQWKKLTIWINYKSFV
jgi:hypothetical protein